MSKPHAQSHRETHFRLVLITSVDPAFIVTATALLGVGDSEVFVATSSWEAEWLRMEVEFEVVVVDPRILV